MRFTFSNLRPGTKRGFTLIELMVTVGIFVFMTALILSRYSGYNSGTLLTNLAYDVALTIRQAQTYGLSVVTTGGGDFHAAYGVHYDKGEPTKFFLYSDWNNSGIYDAGDVVEVPYNLKQGAKITDLCVGEGSSCLSNVTKLDISFARPEPAAVICGYEGASCGSKRGYAEITVTSRDGSSDRIITVNKVGQIVVGN